MATEDTQYCPACGIVVPIVQPVIGRAICALAPALGVQLLGKRGAKSLGGTLLVAGIGLSSGISPIRPWTPFAANAAEPSVPDSRRLPPAWEPLKSGFVREVLFLSQRALAKSMNVAPFTVSRWESGASSPTGLQEEVLRALYNKAVELKKANDDDGAKTRRWPGGARDRCPDLLSAQRRRLGSQGPRGGENERIRLPGRGRLHPRPGCGRWS